MDFAGEIKTIGLREVFENIAFRKLSGVLTMTEREHGVLLCFEEGMLRAFCPGPDRPFDYAAIAEACGAAGAEQ
ncbi:MAG: hypothetical protein ACYTGV_06790, partial [Planctomycetota bacterium]